MVRSIDALILFCSSVWIFGGIPWKGALLFHHGADPRRAALLIGLLAYLGSKQFRKRSFFVRAARSLIQVIQRPKVQWLVLALACVWAMGIGTYQMLALRFTMYDVGIFHQILWALSTGHGYLSTVSGAGNFLTDHLAPSLAVLAPFYFVFGKSPLLIAILHPLVIFGGAASWVWLAKNLPNASSRVRQRMAGAVVLVIISFDSLWANLRWGFHETALSFFFLSWSFALLIARPSFFWRPVILLILAAFSKETGLLFVPLIFMVWSSRERWTHRILLYLISVAMIAGFLYFQSLPHPEGKNYFLRYYSYLGSNPREFLLNLLKNPWAPFQQMGALSFFKYFWVLLSPFLLVLPFVAPKGVRIFGLSLIPSVATAALATYAPLRESGFHYVLEIWPALMALSLTALAQMRSKITWIWVGFIVISLGQDPLHQVFEYRTLSIERTELRDRLSSIPSNSTICAHEEIGTWLAARESIWRYPDCDCTDWLILPANTVASTKCGYLTAWSAAGWTAYQR